MPEKYDVAAAKQRLLELHKDFARRRSRAFSDLRTSVIQVLEDAEGLAVDSALDGVRLHVATDAGPSATLSFNHDGVLVEREGRPPTLLPLRYDGERIVSTVVDDRFHAVPGERKVFVDGLNAVVDALVEIAKA